MASVVLSLWRASISVSVVLVSSLLRFSISSDALSRCNNNILSGSGLDDGRLSGTIVNSRGLNGGGLGSSGNELSSVGLNDGLSSVGLNDRGLDRSSVRVSYLARLSSPLSSLATM